MIHTPTLLLVNILLFATLAISLGLVARRDRSDGLLFWAVALAVHAVAYVLFSLRGVASEWVSVVLANTLLAATFALMHEGVTRFQQRSVHRALVWGPVAVMLVVFAAFPGVIQGRVLTATVLLCFQMVLIVRQLRLGWLQTPGLGKRFMVTGFVLFALMLIARAASVMMGRTDIVSVTDSNLIQAATFMLASAAMLLVCFGMVVMTKERADERNRLLAMHDELTGINNRRYIQQTLAQHIAQAQRFRRPLSVLMLDIDHFKRVNDTHGHLSGDKVLHDVAVCIQGRLRAQDIAGRWGGEEFIVLLPDTDAEGAMTLAEQLRRAVEQARFTALDGQGVPLTISIGLHTLQVSYEDDRDDMVGPADRALYRAKEQGRNRVVAV